MVSLCSRKTVFVPIVSSFNLSKKDSYSNRNADADYDHTAFTHVKLFLNCSFSKYPYPAFLLMIGQLN